MRVVWPLLVTNLVVLLSASRAYICHFGFIRGSNSNFVTEQSEHRYAVLVAVSLTGFLAVGTNVELANVVPKVLLWPSYPPQYPIFWGSPEKMRLHNSYSASL